MNTKQQKCGHEGIDWDGKGNCITCARDKVLGVNTKQQIENAVRDYNYKSTVLGVDGDIAFDELIEAIDRLVTEAYKKGYVDVDGILALNQHALKVALELIGNVEKGAITNRKYKFVEELRQAFNKYYGGEK